MNFALLGTEPESIALARAAEAAGHIITWCGDVADGASLASNWPREDLGQQWEALLDLSMVDAVIVGSGLAGSQLRTEQVNQLTKAGVAVLTTFPLVDSVLAYYEIDMARCESDALLQHFNPLAEQHEIIERCAQWIAGGHPELGSIEQVVWERPLQDRTRERVLWHFSRDVELLSLVAGRLNRLGALGSPDEAATYSGLSVQLLGKSEVPVRWQVGPIESSADPRLVLIAKHGKLTIDFDEFGNAIKQSTSQDGQTESTPITSHDVAKQTVEQFVKAVKQRHGKASTWPRALRAMELTDTIEISLRRGRMIEVHQQQLTEQLAFKGTMSALGCGVLILIPPLLLLCGWLAELMGVPIANAKKWPHILLLLLALFLGLQLIPKLLFKPSYAEQDSEEDTQAS